ncbi:MAG TPA: hypothetical protein VMN57_05030 [Anaerolineales bacterium]|nr:hypothetical protein [Anaerolineales bacterium]
MKLKIPLIFHFNQHLVEFAGLANRVCYRGLLRTLLDSNERANIHISGTLIQSLNWIDPEPLDLIRSGLASGQFELMGSTHSQNILLACDDWDNREQMKLHREILEDTFSVRPDSFWNPERCWSQSLVPLIAEAGYRTVTVEDHILDRSGGRERVMYETNFAGASLRVVRDDERFKHLFNYSAWFGKPERVLRYLDRVAEEVGDESAVFAYAEDAEAMGLWGYAFDVVPGQTWDRLGTLLEAIALREDVETILLRDLPAPARSLERIEDGSAAWMDASLGEADRPYHEDGYRDWFHFLDTSPKLQQGRRQYTAIREKLQEAPADGPLVDLARHAFLTHQYEFGCIGIGGPGTRVWSGAGSAVSLLQMAAAEPGIRTEDWNEDREEEIVVRTADQVVVLTRSGGRVLYWADLGTGRLIVGNPSSVVPGPFAGESVPPSPLKYPWSDLPMIYDYTQYIEGVVPPTPMRKYLPDWIWTEEDGPLTLALFGDRTPVEQRETLTAQQGAFLDELHPRGGPAIRFPKFTRTGLTFTSRSDSGLELSKTYTLSQKGLSIAYRLSGRVETPIGLRIAAEISGDYAENLRSGRSAVEILAEERTTGVRSTSGETIRMSASPPGGAFSFRESFHAITIVYSLELENLGGDPFEFTLDLVKDPKD